MGLAVARFEDGEQVTLEGPGPFACLDLHVLSGRRFILPCDDPFVSGTGDAEHAYLDGARGAWESEPEYMDFLDPDSPCHALKATEHALYLTRWQRWLEGQRLVLDVGCGIGRFTLPLLDQGTTVHGVDADHESLLRCAWRAGGRAGSLDLHWSSVHKLPEVTVDVAMAVEVLCYVPDALGALRQLASRVRPGGMVLMSMEARWGWALAPDAPPGRMAEALSGDGIVSCPGEGWVHTRSEAEVRALLVEAGLEPVEIWPSHYVLDGPLEQVAGEDPALDDILAWEEVCREHPVWGPLNRLWLVAARKPDVSGRQ